MHSGCCTPVHEIDSYIHCFGPIWLRHVLLVQHGPRYIEDVPILSFNSSALLQCMSTQKFSLNSFFAKVCRENVKELFFTFVLSKTSNISTHFFFDSGFEFLEVCQHFILVAHRIDLSISRIVVYGCDIVSASSECCCLCCFPHVVVKIFSNSVKITWNGQNRANDPSKTKYENDN